MHFDRVGSPFCWGGPLGPMPKAAQEAAPSTKHRPKAAPDSHAKVLAEETGDEEAAGLAIRHHIAIRPGEVAAVFRPVPLDCQSCGACCCNAAENKREGRADYVPVEPSAPLWSRSDLVRKLVVLGPSGAPHLRMTKDGRCQALLGAIGRKVSCGIYHHRPRACRTVQPGDGDCLRARREQGLT